jgi:hypothetical protein
MAATWRKPLGLAHNARIPAASLKIVGKRKPEPKPSKESADQSIDKRSETEGAVAKPKRGAANRSSAIKALKKLAKKAGGK